MRRRRTSLIVFSGLDGAGKSTQIELLRARLVGSGVGAAVLWVRGGYTPGLTAAKTLARRVGGRRIPGPGESRARTAALRRGWIRRAWLALALADLLVVGIGIRFRRLRGRTVICDRYLADTLIDFRLNFPAERVERWWLWRLVTRLAPRPDAAFLLLVPVAESLRRSDVKREPFRDPPAVLARRLAEYEALAGEGDHVILDGTRPAAALAAEIATVVGAPAAHIHAYQPAA
jgi:thymidylate kinase